MKDVFTKLRESTIFKLIMGLGNNDLENIKKLAAIYSCSGADMFDLTPNKEIFKSVCDGIESQGLNPKNYSFCVSFSIGEDKHGTKAYIEQQKCVKCLKCIKQCPYKAIGFNKDQKLVSIDQSKCIGCQKCHCSAIKYTKQNLNIIDRIRDLAQTYKIDCIELHISTKKIKDCEDIFKRIKKDFPDIPVGICLSRLMFSDSKLNKIIKKFKELNNGEKLIIQADGLSMKGGTDGYSSTLQAAATAQIIEDKNNYIILSGGTNSKTTELLKLCDIKANGISFGSYGRLLVSEELNNQEFWYNKQVFNSAVSKAKKLVDSVKVL